MFDLRFSKDTPIYEQLIDHIKEMIIKQVLLPDEKMPSVRALAGQLTISPNTIQKAYGELEQQGYIYSIPGKGSYVQEMADDTQNNQYIKELYGSFNRVVLELLHMNETKEDIKRAVDRCEV
ncbi:MULTISPECIES: GntR family transcriptional regulator [Nosocomiicoccus]|uniref:GntR family transcriptional regulator n=1 Tax=Nosocomiicoccus massiliensis TaxID=1232430 RepID=A0AAF0YMJ1_9STAP|nr:MULTISPECIES: GntR family transcriptional regulator [Nosocomiicoccus]MDK6863583.1 GntR family transcriptional regulator [Nosocomiicoccus ampullae]OFL48871.1 hypothetical protein HMPREF2767_07010 [Nosocomiicoccus sp. HMSC067E10]OFO53626.1 hypothetical protein HMPREF3029_05560 [Nosocomiicoccus sp. HMSC059G07]OFS62015.1 hypothetical protein HMPREF3177_06890 [Nosocomiicoccus sp. HMSC09A07]WOS95912.1 GntR family transcriptional regulator [Nosocomiicoccus massiliensis]